MKQSIIGGIKTIDHAMWTDDECIELAKKNDVIFVSTLQIFQWASEKKNEGTGLNEVVESYKRIHGYTSRVEEH